MGAVITDVEENSPAGRAGIRAGQTLLKINGETVRDVLDYRFYSYDAGLCVELREPDGGILNVSVQKGDGEELGLSFATYLMDAPRSCSNKCIFCFIDQLPPGLRRTLYFKDDDARLSFLMGNYVSLTNLSERDLLRIMRQRISPLGISVHATEPELRAFMLGNPRGAQGYAIMKRLAEAGIRMKCQVVVCPGINDGEHLDRTLGDLAALFPQVESVSVVPVGLTRHRRGLAKLKPVGREDARGIIAAADKKGDECISRFGGRVVFCADELFIKAGYKIPDIGYYEDFPQYENGVGMLALFEDEFLRALETQSTPRKKAAYSVATGMAARPYIGRLADLAHRKCGAVSCNVYGIKNLFLGESVDVAGLVCGADLMEQLEGRPLGERLLIPETMLRHGGDLFLDGVTPRQVSERLGVSLEVLPTDGGALLKRLWSSNG